jgi:ligand-binding sensor protein
LESAADTGKGQDIDEPLKTEKTLLPGKERRPLKCDATLPPDTEMGDQDLEEIIDVPSVQALMEDFFALTQMGIAVIDLKGKVLVKAGWQDACTRFHRVNPQTRKSCIESDLELSRDVKKGEFREYKCKNNMWDTVTPLYIGNRHVGNVFFGQYFYDDEDIDYEYFTSQAEK